MAGNFRLPSWSLLLLFLVLLHGSCVCLADDDDDDDNDFQGSGCSIDHNKDNGTCKQPAKDDVDVLLGYAGGQGASMKHDRQSMELYNTDEEEEDDDDDDSCQDLHEECETWANHGECIKNPLYMILNCQYSCELCPYLDDGHDENGPNNCKDDNEQCEFWASKGECAENPGYMEDYCRLSCRQCLETMYSHDDLLNGLDLGVQQTTTTASHDNNDNYSSKKQQQQIRERIRTSRIYKKSSKILLPSLKAICLNKHERCSEWALDGECDKNPKYMKQACAPACFSCEYLTVEGRCPIDPNAPNVWGPGDLHKMFTRLSTDPYYLSNYNTQILSSPNDDIDIDDNNHHHRPWIITMDNVITKEEANVLIQVGGEGDGGYKRSYDVGERRADGTYEHNINDNRTSTHSWCREGSPCDQNELVQGVIARLTNITGIPAQNSEQLQLLRYEPGQFYGIHHDYIEHQIERQQGVRVLTLYLYLNEVEAGGGTNFDQLDITVMPKMGRALLWPSVLNDFPNEKDESTTHQALPVEAGMKYGANAWFHMRDFKTPFKNRCAR